VIYEISTEGSRDPGFEYSSGRNCGSGTDDQSPDQSRHSKRYVSLYADQAGLGSVEAARMAIEDAGGNIGSQPIELVSADHQHKTDVGTSIVMHWLGRRRRRCG
jgi:hypothetical protein